MKTYTPSLIFHLHTIITLCQSTLSFQLHPMSPLHQIDRATQETKSNNRVGLQSSAMVDMSEEEEADADNYFNIADDISQSSYIKRITQLSNDDDVFWSIGSNAFFVGGGLFYMIGSCWDLALSNSDSESQHMMLYYSVWILGPFVYLLNSCIDVTWSIRTMVAEKKRRVLKRFFMTAQQHAANVGSEGDTGREVMLALEKFDRHAALLDEKLIEGARLSGKQDDHVKTDVMAKLRRHFGHRRDLSSATTFGIAAIFGTASAVGWASGSMSEDTVYMLELVSIHVYLLSAVFALVGLRQETRRLKFTGIMDFFEDAQAMESVGDLLFGIASIVDVVLDDFTFDDDNPWWPIVSAVLWMADALFYLRGDFVVLYRKQKSESDETSIEMIRQSRGDREIV